MPWTKRTRCPCSVLNTNAIVSEDGRRGEMAGQKALLRLHASSWFLSMFYLHGFKKADKLQGPHTTKEKPASCGSGDVQERRRALPVEECSNTKSSRIFPSSI